MEKETTTTEAMRELVREVLGEDWIELKYRRKDVIKILAIMRLSKDQLDNLSNDQLKTILIKTIDKLAIENNRLHDEIDYLDGEIEKEKSKVRRYKKDTKQYRRIKELLDRILPYLYIGGFVLLIMGIAGLLG